jgi:predicted phosphoribosyltransferase
LIASNHFKSVGEFYEDFRQVEDEQVIQTLNTS